MVKTYKGHIISVTKGLFDWWNYFVTKNGQHIVSGQMRETSANKVFGHLKWDIDHPKK